jgi:hypothetical protein
LNGKVDRDGNSRFWNSLTYAADGCAIPGMLEKEFAATLRGAAVFKASCISESLLLFLLWHLRIPLDLLHVLLDLFGRFGELAALIKTGEHHRNICSYVIELLSARKAVLLAIWSSWD